MISQWRQAHLAQSLISNTIHKKREPGLLGEMADSRAGAGHTQDDPGALCARKQGIAPNTYIDGGIVKPHAAQ